MVINDKGLLRAMKEAYKGPGYEIGCRKSGDIKEIYIETSSWFVTCEVKALSRKIIGLIAEHLGEIPQQGQCFQVKKRESQTKIMEESRNSFGGICPDDCINPESAYKTSLAWRQGNIWKCSERGNVLWIDPDLEELLNFQSRAYCLGGKVLHMSDTTSAVSILPDSPEKEEDKRIINSLAKIVF